MKTFLLLFVVIVLPLLANAQGYAITSHQVAGGGGTSTSAHYLISGTIGQHDASLPMTGGGYAVTGGFWGHLFVVQGAGVPGLRIVYNSPGSVSVLWPATGSYTLQQNSNLATGAWITSGDTVSTVSGTNSVTITPPAGNLFFRLSNP